MEKAIGFYPCPDLDTAATTVVSYAGTRLLTETIGKVGLDRALSRVLEPWRPRLAVHDPAKVLLDLALALAVGGDCLSDIALLRAEPALFGPVASDPTVSRTIDRLAADSGAVLAAIDTARAAARAQAWALAGDAAPDHDTDAARPLVIDVDATLVTAHSDKQGAAPTFKKGFGHHPLWAFVDHGPAGTGEPLAALLRPGNAGSNTAADHITVIRSALQQLRGHKPGNRAGRKVLIRVDGAGASHDLLDWLHRQRLSYSVGFGLTQALVDQLAALPATDWQIAVDADGEPRPGARVIEATGLMNLKSWPTGMRVIVRKERPHPGAQLRITDPDGLRYTAFATNTRPGGPGRQLADLELRHRRRARAEDRIRAAKDTGLTNLPLHELDQNRIWQAVVALASEITAWAQMLAYTDHPARRWEPKRLRLRLLSTPPSEHVTPAGPFCIYPRTHPGPGCSATASPGYARSPFPAESDLADTNDRGTRPDQWKPAPTRATSAELSHPTGRISPPHRPAPVSIKPATPDERSGRGPDRDSGGRAHDVRPPLPRAGESALSRMIEPGSEFGRLFRSFEHTAYRLETRDLYRSANESEALRQFVAGEPVGMEWFHDWLCMIREATAAGRRFSRVRVVSMPLTDYSRFGVYCSGYTNSVGEVTRYLARGNADGLPDHDYWLFDSSKLVRMHFDDDENFLGGELIEDPAVIVQHNYWRDAAWHRAVRRDEFATQANGGQHQRPRSS